MDFCNVAIFASPIELPPPIATVGAGAMVDFIGVVRPTENDRTIAAIDYEFHPTLAETELRRIAAEAREKFSIFSCTLLHRVGRVPAGEASLFLRVQTAHRAPAYDASRWIVEQLKVRVPIWKRVLPLESVN